MSASDASHQTQSFQPSVLGEAIQGHPPLLSAPLKILGSEIAAAFIFALSIFFCITTVHLLHITFLHKYIHFFFLKILDSKVAAGISFYTITIHPLAKFHFFTHNFFTHHYTFHILVYLSCNLFIFFFLMSIVHPIYHRIVRNILSIPLYTQYVQRN